MKVTETDRNHTNLENWFVKFKDQYEHVFIDNFANHERGFAILSEEYNLLLQEKETKNKTEAWDFSIFDIVTIKRLEENLHSPLLGELLDTRGSHGQKDLFYRLFLNEVVGKDKAEKFFNTNPLDYLTRCEEFIKNQTDKGEIDITIKSTNRHNKFAIILENKWGSGDSCPDQIYKYYRNFTNPKGKAYTDENLLIIYLTKYGNNPKWIENKDFESFLTNNIGVNYFPISYIYHVKNWLEQCLILCESQKVKFTIEQYLNLIRYGVSN